jgi:hypothetical protein
MSRHIVPIVEGYGEVSSVPLLVRRIARECAGVDVDVRRPIRVARGKLTSEGELKRAVELAARQSERAGILILLDGDDDVPCVLGPRLLGWARRARADRPCSVVVAQTEYENWFIASIESLRGMRGIPRDAIAPGNPETIRGAKEWLAALMGRAYSEITDQPALTARFDLALARNRSLSFDKLLRDIDAIISDA